MPRMLMKRDVNNDVNKDSLISREKPVFTEKYYRLRASLHGGCGPQVGEVSRLAAVEKWPAITYNLTTAGSGVKFLQVVVWSLSMLTDKTADEQRVFGVNALFLSLAALAGAFQCCGFLLSLLMIQILRQRQLTVQVMQQYNTAVA